MTIAFLGVFIAGFLAFKTEYDKLLLMDKSGCSPYDNLSTDQSQLLTEAFSGLKPKIEMGHYGDVSTSIMARSLSSALGKAGIEAPVGGMGELDSPTENGIELAVRNHLHPDTKSISFISAFAKAKIPYSIIELYEAAAKTDTDMLIFVAPHGSNCRS